MNRTLKNGWMLFVAALLMAATVTPSFAVTTPLGMLGNGVSNLSGSLDPGDELDFYTFSLALPVLNGDGSYLSIETFSSTGGDTEIALYNAAGDLLYAENDNKNNVIGGDLMSQLSFGDGDPFATGMGAPDEPVIPGQHGTLMAGAFQLVIAPFDTVFTPTVAGIGPDAQFGGWQAFGPYDLDIRVNLVTAPPPPMNGDIPEPTTAVLGLLGVAGLAMRRR